MLTPQTSYTYIYVHRSIYLSLYIYAMCVCIYLYLSIYLISSDHLHSPLSPSINVNTASNTVCYLCEHKCYNRKHTFLELCCSFIKVFWDFSMLDHAVPHQQENLFIFSNLSVFSFSFFFKLLCWVGVHCDIYKSSYNVSNIYLSSPPPLLSFIPSPSKTI
jgi:hypothetical protein